MSSKYKERKKARRIFKRLKGQSIFKEAKEKGNFKSKKHIHVGKFKISLNPKIPFR